MGVFEQFVEVDDEGVFGYSAKDFFFVHDVLDNLGLLNVLSV